MISVLDSNNYSTFRLSHTCRSILIDSEFPRTSVRRETKYRYHGRCADFYNYNNKNYVIIMRITKLFTRSINVGPICIVYTWHLVIEEKHFQPKIVYIHVNSTHIIAQLATQYCVDIFKL